MAESLTPEWWLPRLEAEIRERHDRMAKFDNYYSGRHPLPFLTPSHADKIQDEFRRMLDESKSNFCRLVVDAVDERLKVDGLRLGPEKKETDPGTWALWQENNLDQESQSAFLEALVKGMSYMSVWMPGEGSSYATVAVEDPMQTVVAYEPGSNFRRRSAAAKIWLDDRAGVARANVYLPDGVYKYQAEADADTFWGRPSRWPHERYAPNPGSGGEDRSEWKELPGNAFYVQNPHGIVPIVPLRNRPRLRCEGESELVDIVNIQNQINGFLFLLALAGYFGAHRQRWAVGLKLTKDDAGNAIEPFDVAIDRLMTMENPEGRFGEFEQTDLDPYIKAIEQKVLHIAVITRTPRHYLIEQGQSPSGDAIQSAESGLVKKIERKQVPFGEGLEEAMRLARLFSGLGDTEPGSEVVWASAEVRSQAQIVDASVKLVQEGLIDRVQALEDMGYSPQQISRIEAADPQPRNPTPTPAATL